MRFITLKREIFNIGCSNHKVGTKNKCFSISLPYSISSNDKSPATINQFLVQFSYNQKKPYV